jgi:hypothetical protein
MEQFSLGAYDMNDTEAAVHPVSARIRQLERMFAQLQQREGECLTIAEASRHVSELIDAIIDTKASVDASPHLDPGLRTEVHTQLDDLYRVLTGSIGPIGQ